MRTKSNMKKLKFFLTFHKERQWLEKMALQGYMLELVVFVAAAGLLLNLFLEKISGGAAEARTDTVKIYNALCGIYVAATSFMACVLFKVSKIMYEDFRMMPRENRQIHKETRLIMTTKGLQNI